jgi:hypothetical protein
MLGFSDRAGISLEVSTREAILDRQKLAREGKNSANVGRDYRPPASDID